MHHARIVEAHCHCHRLAWRVERARHKTLASEPRETLSNMSLVHARDVDVVARVECIFRCDSERASARR